MGMTVGEQQAFRSVTASLPKIAEAISDLTVEDHYVTQIALDTSNYTAWIACRCGLLMNHPYEQALGEWNEHYEKAVYG